MESKIGNLTSSTIVQKKPKIIYLGIHLRKHVYRDERGNSLAVQWLALPLQGAQVRSLVRELRSHMPHSMAKKKDRERWQTLSKFIYRLNAIPIKIPAAYTVDTYRIILKYVRKGWALKKKNILIKNSGRNHSTWY